MPGPTQEATPARPFAPPPITLQDATIEWGFLLSTGTTKSKLCADNVLKIRSKLQSGFGITHTPAPAAPVGLLQMKSVPRAAQSDVAVQAVVVVVSAHSASCENN